MKPFMDADFLLQTDTAKTLYHEAAEKMPIFDYHNHLNPSGSAGIIINGVPCVRWAFRRI